MEARGHRLDPTTSCMFLSPCGIYLYERVFSGTISGCILLLDKLKIIVALRIQETDTHSVALRIQETDTHSVALRIQETDTHSVALRIQETDTHSVAVMFRISPDEHCSEAELVEGLRVLKVSICNVFHAFRSLPNTTITNDLAESIEKGTISALILFLGHLVERLEVYRLQEANVEEMKGLLEDTSSMNCTLIAEKEIMKTEIIDIVETCDTYEEIKKKLVTMLNKTDKGQHTRSAKRQRVSVNSLCKTTKPKRVRSSQLRSRHPMYEVSSLTRTLPPPIGRNSLPEGTSHADRRTKMMVNVKMMEPDDVIEVSSRDGDSGNTSKDDDVTDEGEISTSVNGNEQGDCSLSDSSKKDLILNLSQSPRTRKRGQYSRYDKVTRLEIAHYASEHGASKTSRHFSSILGHKVSESTVRSMVQQCAKGLLKDVTEHQSINMDIKEEKRHPDLCDVDKNPKSDEETYDQTYDDRINNPSATESLPHWSTMMSETGRRKRGNYVQYDEVTRAEIGKHALKHGVASASRHFTEAIGRKVSESTIRSMRDQCYKLQQKGVTDISALPSGPRGAPTLLGTLDSKLQKWIQDVRMQGGQINTRIVMAAADGIVMKYARHKLKRFGGDITITKHYARSLLRRMGLEKPKDLIDVRNLPNDFETIKSNFVSQVKNILSENSVPDSLIINWNHFDCQLVPGGNWTQEHNVDPNMSACSLDDKCQISMILGITQSGHMLPPQIVYHGRTDRCLLNEVTFPCDWDVIYSDSPSGNEKTMLRYLDRIILPYVSGIRASLPVTEQVQQAVALFDATEANYSEDLHKKLKENGIITVCIPASCKGLLQPVELSVNSAFRDSMKQNFIEWYSQEVFTTLLQPGTDSGGTVIDMKTARLKPIHARWVIKAYMDLEDRRNVIQAGFVKAGLLDGYSSQQDNLTLEQPMSSSSSSSLTDNWFNLYSGSLFLDPSKSKLCTGNMMNPL